ncbi:ABC transporter ATP-binding protein [Clostridium sp.]|uniref:ABC transporter ATP-binding protein n=1 Tax=Clostridium sp. TaxID=1506 RepID=UPI00258BAB4B|nr:ABC transporter ATP-binding protein [Clostridium sp.]MCI6139672.1 ABC transporter ATP-binding protein [Clostridium sp.]
MNLTAKDVEVSISGKKIIRNLSVQIPNRKFSALLGANGSGKTTLLRAIYRTQKMDNGVIYLNDLDISKFSGKKLARKLAVMGQFNQINFDYTVMDVALIGRYPFHSLLEQEKEKDYEIALEALEKVGMKQYRERNFQSLSGGEKQRVILARALTQSPQILILDEPTNHLDIRYRLEILSLIKELNITVLAALHDLGLAVQFCDYLYMMKQGEIVAEGKPKQVINHDTLWDIFEVNAEVYPSPVNGKLMIQYV